MPYRVAVASLAFTLLAVHQVRADDRYSAIDMSVKTQDRAVAPRQASKARHGRKSRLYRRNNAHRTTHAAKASRAARKAARVSRRLAPRKVATIHRRILPPPQRALSMVSQPPRIATFLPPPAPRIEPTPPAPHIFAPPSAPMDPEQLAFERAWNRIAERVSPERVLGPAAEAVGHFVAAVDGATRALAERTVVGLARQFLIETATIGGTMQRQTPEVAIGRLHPVFARRLAAATREARAAGLPHVGCFSAYREPGLRVGGFRDKHASLHAYGLACDMAGIGPPGSESAKLWHEIASRHGLYNPYEFVLRRKRQLVHMPAWRHPWEWNHYQPTGIRAILRNDALRRTVTAQGPIDLERMWEVGSRLIDLQPRVQARVILAGKGKHKVRHAAAHRSKVAKLRSKARRAYRQRLKRLAHHKRVAALEIRADPALALAAVMGVRLPNPLAAAGHWPIKIRQLGDS